MSKSCGVAAKRKATHRASVESKAPICYLGNKSKSQRGDAIYPTPAVGHARAEARCITPTRLYPFGKT